MARERLQAGKRDRLITIEELVQPSDEDNPDEVDSEGAPIETWQVLVDRMPAARLEATGAERFRTAQTSAPLETRWEINYRIDMDPDLVDVAKARRVVLDGRVHDITSAEEIGRKRGIELRTLAKAG